MADIYNVFCYFLSLVWIYKIQILGSLFVSLTAFEYFYRGYLLIKRKKQIQTLKSFINDLKKTTVGKDNTQHDLEHQILMKNVEKISIEFGKNNELINYKIDQNQRVLLTMLKSEFEVVNFRIDSIDGKSTAALDKIKEIEKETDFIKSIKRYKYVVGLAFIGLISITNFEKIQSWVKGLFPWN